MRKLLLVGVVLLALASIGAASAATNLVKNGGFEEPPLGEDVGFVECPDTYNLQVNALDSQGFTNLN
jgi:hypothetical protein